MTTFDPEMWNAETLTSVLTSYAAIDQRIREMCALRARADCVARGDQFIAFEPDTVTYSWDVNRQLLSFEIDDELGYAFGKVNVQWLLLSDEEIEEVKASIITQDRLRREQQQARARSRQREIDLAKLRELKERYPDA